MCYLQTSFEFKLNVYLIVYTLNMFNSKLNSINLWLYAGNARVDQKLPHNLFMMLTR